MPLSIAVFLFGSNFDMDLACAESEHQLAMCKEQGHEVLLRLISQVEDETKGRLRLQR